MFEEAASIMEKRGIKPESQLTQFRSLGLRAQNIAVQNFRKETDYSDAPDEFRGQHSGFLSIIMVVITIDGVVL